MLLEEGFEVVSSDASDKMLKQAYKLRWDRRKEDVFDKWRKQEKQQKKINAQSKWSLDFFSH